MQPQPFRVAPLLPAWAMKTFQVASPRATHFRPASCAEAECDAYLHGWEPRIVARPADWVDEFATHQSKIAEAIEKG
jgi:hypothetical protein